MFEDSFFRSHVCRVEVHHESLGSIGFGELSFGNGGWPTLHLEQSMTPPKLTDGEAYPKLTATTDTGEVLSLIACAYHGRSVLAEAMIEGDPGEAFRGICIRLVDVSEWFLSGRNLVSRDASTTSAQSGPIDVAIRAGENSFSLRSTVVSASETQGNQAGEDYVRFTFEPHKNPFGMEDVRLKCRELSGLISLLLAQVIDVQTVWVIGESAQLHATYFPHFNRKQDQRKGWFIPRCLIQRNRLDGQWQQVIENYYRSPFREVAWARMAGMLRYDSFWEYRVIGYFSMLDGVMEERLRGQSIPRVPPARRKIDEFIRRAGHLAEPLSSGQLSRLVGIVKEMFSKSDSVGARYRLATAASDRRVMSVINISDDDLETITEIRNQIAHGGALKLPEGGPETLMLLVDKVVVLLTYWAYVDLGFSDDVFLKCLHASHNPLLRDDRIDRFLLDRELGEADFYAVSAERFESLAAIKTIRSGACFTRDGTGEIEYSERHTSMLKAWQQSGVSGRITPESIFGLPSRDVTFSPKAYVHSGERRLDLHWIYVIEREDPVVQ
jgi:hypothetical protein